MINASQALNSIEQASRRLRSDEERLDAIIEAASAETARLRSEQAGLFRSLARIRLDELRQDRISGELDEAERRAKAALQQQKHRLEALAQRAGELAEELATARAERTAAASRVSEAVDAVAALEEAVAEKLAEDVEWQAQAARLEGARERAQAAEDKALQAEADRDEKSKPYLADPLFAYLWNRGYGTPAYRGGRFARLGDGYVARVVNYEPARRDYFTLNEIPTRLREHAERLKAEVADEEEALGAIERAALEAEGLASREAAHTAAEADLDAAEARIAALEGEDAALERERHGLLDEEGGQALAGALQDLSVSMQREDLRVLLREALATPTPEDERIVARLQEIESAIGAREREAAEARRTALDLARKRAELDRSRDEFRRSGYERGGGGFSNDKLIGDIIGGIIGGVLSSRELGDALRSGYRPGKSRSSAPAPRSGGGVFGGGFRTGGRF